MGHVRARANRYNFAVAFFVALGSFTYGFNSAIIGSVIGPPYFYQYFDFVLTSSYGGSIIGPSNGLQKTRSPSNLGGLYRLNSHTGGLRPHRHVPRRSVLQRPGSWTHQHGYPDLHLSEISPFAQRGRIVGSHGFIICFSYAASGWAGFGTYYEKNPTVQWRLLLALQIVAPLLLLIGSPFIPESPRWLVNNGKHEQGLKVLEKLHAHPSDPEHIGAQEEFLQIQRQLELEHAQPNLNMIQLLMFRKYRKRMIFGFYLQAMCQSTRCLVISNYMVLLLTNLGVKGSIPLLLLAVYNSWAAALNYINALFIGRIGRIRFILFGLSGCIFCLIVLTALSAHYTNIGNPNKTCQGACIAFMFLFVTFYGFGVDVSSYVYCSEIFPTNIRAKGVGFSISGLFLITTMYTTAAGPVFNHIGWKHYLVFVLVTSCMLPYFAWAFPETKGLSLEEVGGLFGDEVVAVGVSHLTRRAATRTG